ncbi:MAG TPA: AI-2E family transporter, partial [Candidatus Cloacimonadota bacterium]|nr:AI-2E family transporter [Candidatus Cloacimonadota bacterium]
MNWTKLFFYIFLGAIVVAAFIFYRWVFIYLIASMIFSYILDPAVTLLERKGIPRWLGVIMIYLSVAGLIAWFTSRYIPDLIQQGNSLISLLGDEEHLTGQAILKLPFIRGIYQFLLNLDRQIPGIGAAPQFALMMDGAKDFLAEVPKFLVDNYQTIIGTLSFIGMIPLISFFLLKNKHMMRKSLLRLSSNRYFELCLKILTRIDNTVGTFLRAMLFEVIAVSILASIALTIVGVSNPILIGITAGVANIIPYFGPFMGGALAALTVLFSGGPFIGVVYAAFAMYLVQVIDNNIVYPVVVGTTISMHPLLVLLT